MLVVWAKERGTVVDAWNEYERAQKNRRSDRMPKRRAEVEALRGKGYDVRELAFGHFRIDGKLDLYLLHRRFHFLPTDERGGYIKAAQIAPELLRRRRKQRTENPSASAEILSSDEGLKTNGARKKTGNPLSDREG